MLSSNLNSADLSPEDIVIPSSFSTVSIKALISFERLDAPAEIFFSRAPGTKEEEPLQPFAGNGHAFLVEHAPSGRKVVFDLGMRKNREGHTPAMLKVLGDGHVIVDRDVADQLQEGGMDLSSIEAVIWSHTHVDHTGDISTFPHSTSLVVGPGAKDTLFPAYPTNPNASYPESDFEGRNIHEITFPTTCPVIGSFKAHDYFGDGSFYLLDTPGHCIGHMAGLARVTTDSFALFAGDGAHHVAQLRPSHFVPLPQRLRSKLPESLKDAGAPTFDGPFLHPPTGGYCVHDDRELAAQTTRHLQAFDAREDILVMLSHDASLRSVLPLFPKELNEWKKGEVKDKVFWAFLEKDDPAYRWEK